MKSFEQRELRYKRFKKTMKRSARVRLQTQKIKGQIQKISKVKSLDELPYLINPHD